MSRPDGKIVVKRIIKTNQDLDEFSNVLKNDPIADHEEMNSFLTAQGQLKRLSDVYEHLVKRRDEKEAELKNLKSKGDRTVSFVNRAHEGEEGEALLPVSEEDAERARELEEKLENLTPPSLIKTQKLEIQFSVYDYLLKIS